MKKKKKKNLKLTMQHIPDETWENINFAFSSEYFPMDKLG